MVQLLGTLVTALVAWSTLSRTLKNDRSKRDEEDAQKINSFLGALKTEITTLWPIYMEKYGKDLEKLQQGQAPGQFPVGDHYFTVYKSNAHLIGHIPKVALRDQIVRTYIVANGMIDTIRLYNTLLVSAEQDNRSPALIQQRWNEVTAYAFEMKAQHLTLKDEVTKLQVSLEAFEQETADNKYIKAQETQW